MSTFRINCMSIAKVNPKWSLAIRERAIDVDWFRPAHSLID